MEVNEIASSCRDRPGPGIWDPLLQCLHLSKHPLKPQNTKELYGYIDACEKFEMVQPDMLIEEENIKPIEGIWVGNNLMESAEIIGRKEQMEEFMFLGLRMNAGVARLDFEEAFGVPIEAVYLDQMNELRQQELISMSEGLIALTDRGMDLANYVMAKFML